MTPPDPVLLQPDRVRQLLRDLELPADRGPRWVQAVVDACPGVAEVPGEPVPTWVVAEHRVRAARPDRVRAADVVCSCGSSACVHVAAVLVVLAFNDPARRASLNAPAWEIALAPMARPRRTGGARKYSHVRYDVRPPTPGERGVDVAVALIPAHGGARPARYPRTVSELQARVHGLQPSDLELHPAWHALERARQLERGKQGETTRHLSRALLAPLSRAHDVRYAGRPVQISAVPITPRIVATHRSGPASGLELVFRPRVRVHWRPVGIVLTDEGVLCPLADDVPAAVADRLMDPLPDIPASHVQDFVDRLVVNGGLDVDLPADIPTVHAADRRSARIALAEQPGHRLQVRLDLVYGRHDGEVAVGPTTEGDTVAIPEEGVVRRDRDWESAEADRFARDLGFRDRGDLAFEPAMAFLEEQLPALTETWEIYGRDGLARLNVAGQLAPIVDFNEGEDWFDVDVTFTLDGREAAAVDVIRSWLNGERYHRLGDGSLATLPTRWLQKHASTVDLLVEVHRAQRRLGSWHAWMASELLEGIGGPAERWLAWVRKLAAFRPGAPLIGEAEPGPGFHGTLRAYQRQGLGWLRFLRDHRLHGVLADEMGLGKTVQALAVLADDLDADRPLSPSLVVAPSSVIRQWEQEAARFTPGLRVLVWHGPRRDPEALDHADLVLTTYSLLRRDRAVLTSCAWTWAILDEAQHIKNPASQAARAARKLKARHRLALTGTPMENDLLELWSLFAFLMPGYLARRTHFHARYTVASDEALQDLAERVRPFLLRRRKLEVAPELPARTEITLRVPLSSGERRLYEQVRLTVVTALEEAEDPQRVRQHLYLDGLLRLRQACCHPGLLPFPEAQRVGRSSKLEVLLDQLRSAIGSGSRCLVFSQWVQLLDRVAERLDHEGFAYLRLQGDTVDRATVVAQFQDPAGPPVFLISTKAGGTGLNLTAADVVFLLDPWWNPQVEDQAAARAHRIGQPRPVTVVRLVAADTVEDRVLALQAQKRRLFEQTVDRGTFDASRMTLDDLKGLLGPPTP